MAVWLWAAGGAVAVWLWAAGGLVAVWRPPVGCVAAPWRLRGGALPALFPLCFRFFPAPARRFSVLFPCFFLTFLLFSSALSLAFYGILWYNLSRR